MNIDEQEFYRGIGDGMTKQALRIPGLLDTSLPLTDRHQIGLPGYFARKSYNSNLNKYTGGLLLVDNAGKFKFNYDKNTFTPWLKKNSPYILGAGALLAVPPILRGLNKKPANNIMNNYSNNSSIPIEGNHFKKEPGLFNTL